MIGGELRGGLLPLQKSREIVKLDDFLIKLKKKFEKKRETRLPNCNECKSNILFLFSFLFDLIIQFFTYFNELNRTKRLKEVLRNINDKILKLHRMIFYYYL